MSRQILAHTNMPSPDRAAKARRAMVWMACGSLLLAGFYVHRWTNLAASGTFRPVDFWAFYSGAALVRDGHGSQLYDLGLQSQYQLQLLGRLPLNGYVLPFINPPHFALALLPLTFLPRHLALYLWLVLQLALAALLIYRYLTNSAGMPRPERIIMLAALASFPMLYVTIYKGQISLIMLLSILLWVDALKKGNDRGIAGWLLVGSIKPQLIIVPFLLTILARRWRALAHFAGGAIVLLAVCTVVLGPGCLRDFLAALRSIDANFEHRIVYPAYMYNFKGFLTLLLGLGQVPLIRMLTFAGLLGTLLLIIAFWRGRLDVNDEGFELKLALSLLLGIFFSSHFYYYDSLLLVAVGKPFYEYLVKSGASIMRRIFQVSLFATPQLFLESSWIPLAGRVVRWPVILMLVWIACQLYYLRFQDPARPVKDPSICR